MKACFGDFVGTAAWRDDKLQIAQRKAIFPEATLEARGLGGQVTRTHWNHVILDDLHDLDRADSEEFSERDARWLDEVLMPTVLPGGTVSIRATCYAWDDLRGRIEERAGEENIFQAEDLRLGGGPLPTAKWRILKVGAILRDGTSLRETLAVLERAAVVTGGDTGPLQMAAALGKPVVALLGGASPLRTGPVGGPARMIFKRWPCAPCYGWRCPLGRPCLAAIGGEEVAAAAREVLSAPPGGPSAAGLTAGPDGATMQRAVR